MTSWYESVVDRQIREAAERGEWDDLLGLGKPLPGHGGEYDEDWWVRDYVRREQVSGVLPATLALRREIEDLPRTVARLRTESAVRTAVAGLNDRIRDARRGLLDGPPVVVREIDADAVVAGWRRTDRT